jgi:TRAP-type mannitol/chloroaromatic compound transport system permease large subunit
MILLAFINAAFPAFLVYGLNRYAYYVTPFMAGAVGILGAVLLSRIRETVSWFRTRQNRSVLTRVAIDANVS